MTKEKKRKPNLTDPQVKLATGDRITKLREALGWSREKLAEELGKDVKQVYRYESGIIFPPGEVLMDLHDIFNVSLDYLTGGDDYKNKDIEFICDKTGLSPEAAEKLLSCKTLKKSLYGKDISIRFTDLFTSMELINCLLSSDSLGELALYFSNACRYCIDLKLASDNVELSGFRDIGYHPQLAIPIDDAEETIGLAAIDEDIRIIKEEAERNYTVERYRLQRLFEKMIDDAVKKTVSQEVIDKLLKGVGVNKS